MLIIKVAINLQLSTIESKKKQSKQTSRTETEYGDHLEGYQLGGRKGEMGWGKYRN